jgi:TonB family protein
METLFSQQPFRKRRLLIMVLVSGLFHVSLVGLAAVWLRPVSRPTPDNSTTLDFDTGLVTSAAAPLTAPEDAPAPAPDVAPVPPPPQDTPLLDEMAPPSSDPDMTEPPPPKKQDKPKSARSTASYPANANRIGAAFGVSSRATGSPGAAHPGAIPVRLPKPPYPQPARLAHLQGSGSIRITFDGAGRVSSAAMVQSVGSVILDDNTLSYARANWQGPPNTTATFAITYRLDQ